MERVSELLLEFIELFHLTGPKRETMDESRFILSTGCCYVVRETITAVLQKEGIAVREDSHPYHAWLIVNGVAYDSLCPLGYTVPVRQFWLLPEMFPGFDPADFDGTEALDGTYVQLDGYLRLHAAQAAFCKRYGIAVRKPQRYDKRAFRQITRRLGAALLTRSPVRVTTDPIPSPNAYFTDCIEDSDNGRRLAPYPYPLSLQFYQSRFKDLKKKGTPVWQM